MRDRSRRSDNLQAPLMYAFRDAFEEGDADKRVEQQVDGERIVAGRGLFRRKGGDEALLKRNLSVDLLSLANTIDLDSVIDLSQHEYVARSVLNYGLPDVTSLTSEEIGVDGIGEALKRALINHEPRLRPESLRVEKDLTFDEVSQRIQFTVLAEMACNPLDVPLEFVAEVEIGSGKVRLTRLPVSA
jgi:type VI secretion system protein ImpF